MIVVNQDERRISRIPVLVFETSYSCAHLWLSFIKLMMMTRWVGHVTDGPVLLEAEWVLCSVPRCFSKTLGTPSRPKTSMSLIRRQGTTRDSSGKQPGHVERRIEQPLYSTRKRDSSSNCLERGTGHSDKRRVVCYMTYPAGHHLH